jgi:hypothetical protein
MSIGGEVGGELRETINKQLGGGLSAGGARIGAFVSLIERCITSEGASRGESHGLGDAQPVWCSMRVQKAPSGV